MKLFSANDEGDLFDLLGAAALLCAVLMAAAMVAAALSLLACSLAGTCQNVCDRTGCHFVSDPTLTLAFLAAMGAAAAAAAVRALRQAKPHGAPR